MAPVMQFVRGVAPAPHVERCDAEGHPQKLTRPDGEILDSELN